MHSADVDRSTRGVEVQLEGTGPWDLRGNAVGEGELDGGVQLVHTPGHTMGCICLWHAASSALFTGDHFGFSQRLGRPSVFLGYNRAGRVLQIDSVRKVAAYG
jgi:glyoxylase-like metal-dependent hydrolase (beta-lactamase superfamily II)